MKWCRTFIAWRRSRRGEAIVKDNSLIIENGGKNSLEYKARKKLVGEINAMLPRVYQERGASQLIRSEMIRPVKSIRRPRKLPFIHHIPGLAVIKLCKREVEMAVLEFRAGRQLIKCACTADGRAYRYYRLYGEDGLTQKEYWMPIYDLQKSNVSSATLRLIKNQLDRIVPKLP